MSINQTTPQIIRPNWSVSKNIQAFSTTRQGGVSQAPWDSLNLATHVNDNVDDVKKNRDLLTKHYALPNEPTWLEQVHSNKIVRLTAKNSQQHFKADAAYTTEKNIVCCVMTADCLPVLFCNKQATWVASVHAGWKGIANGILKSTLAIYEKDLGGNLKDLQVWIGPAISGNAYEVGEEVKAAFIQQDPILNKAFIPNENNHYLLNSSYAAQLQLIECGLDPKQITAPGFCTFNDEQRFYSYRRDGLNTGRMASMLWLS